MRYQSEHQFCKISELLDGGDWACAYGQCGTLSHVCLELARLLEDAELAEKARVVAHEAIINLDEATRRWSELACELRHTPLAHGTARSRTQSDMLH